MHPMIFRIIANSNYTLLYPISPKTIKMIVHYEE